MNGSATRWVGIAALIGYGLSIPAANYFIGHVGTAPAFPGGPHTVPVGFGLDAPSGVVWIGAALVLRDVVQTILGRAVVVAAIAVGAALSFGFAPASVAVASGVAFAASELADFAVYTPLADRRIYAAVLLSGLVGALIDSLLFLQIAFGSTRYWQGNTVAKVALSVAVLPVLWVIRRRPLVRA